MAKSETALTLDYSMELESLVRQYMPLVSKIARRYTCLGPDLLEDLQQVGSIGLLKAVKYYDPDRSRAASFRTLACYYIRGEIRHYLRDHVSMVQVPRRLSEISGQIARLEEVMVRELDRAPSVAELANRSGFSVQEICDAQRSWEACIHYESFDTADEYEESEDSRSLSEVVPDKRYQDFVLAAEDRELIRQALRKLGDRVGKIVEFVYFYDLSQKETAKCMGLSEMVVSRAIRSGLKRLKDILTTDIL